MNLRQALFIVAGMVSLAAVNVAQAQFSGQEQPPKQELTPWPAQQPAQGQASSGQASSCEQEFGKLRDATEKRGLAIRQASEHKVSPQEACGLFNAFTAAEEKMLKYAVDNGVWCGIPPQIIDTIKKGHTKSTEMRTRICRTAATPLRSAGPTLSDALGGSIPDANNIKTGRGTFDTLTGSPLRK
jgi:hypothetical protein